MMANVEWRYMVGDCLAPGLNEINDGPSQGYDSNPKTRRLYLPLHPGFEIMSGYR